MTQSGLSSDELLIKALKAEVEKNPEIYFSDLPGLVEPLHSPRW